MPETQNIEWKQTWHDEYLKWICGFANAQGGKLYIGVRDDGQVVGIENSKRLLEDLPNKIFNALGISTDVNLHQENGMEYLVITVRPSTYPVNYHGEYYRRSGSTNRQLQGIALSDFLTSKSGLRWEDSTVDGVTVEDLDKESLDIFRRQAVRSGRRMETEIKVSNRQLLESLGLLTPNGLSRAAVMLFHRQPDKWIPGCYTTIGKFSSPSHLLFQDEIHGSLFLQAERALELIYLKYLTAPVHFEGINRIELYPFPRDAVREALYNALMHSSWESGQPIQIRIEENNFYINNGGALPDGWTIETLYNYHRSSQHNPKIATAFYYAGYVEKWGRGIQVIKDQCESYGLLPPEYIVTGSDIALKLSRSCTQPEDTKDTKDTKDTNDTNDTNDTTQAIGAGSSLGDAVLSLLRENPDLTQAALASELGCSVVTVKRTMRRLKDKGMLSRRGSSRAGSWHVTGKLYQS